jgi:hypothetical protein
MAGHVAQAPQSVAQVEQVSVASQTVLPQTGHAPQSAEQVEQVSVPLQTASPQYVPPPPLKPLVRTLFKTAPTVSSELST